MMLDLSMISPTGEGKAPNLRLYLLGPPIVEWQGQSICIPRRNTRFLLYRLGAALNERGGMVSREQLCTLFWPDSPDRIARRNLSHLLTHLRRALPHPDLLQTLDGNVSIKPQYTWADTNCLEQVHAVKSNSIPQIEQATRYYRGPFLHGCSSLKSPEFDHWVMRARSLYENQYLELLSKLIDIAWQNGDFESAIASAHRYLNTDYLAEAIHRSLIELYIAIGDISAARGQLETCITILESELGVSPTPETWSVCQAIFQKKSPKTVSRPKVSPQLAILAQGLPFVSRAAELDVLNQELERVKTKQSRFVLINGEPGIGKSRLMRFFASLSFDKALFLESTCTTGARTLPYQPIAEALRGVLNNIVSLPVDTIWLAEVARLLPELRTLLPELPAPFSAEAEEARTRLFEALCFLVQGISSPQVPVILFFDDLQWADISTLEWLAYFGNWLVRKKFGSVLVAGTYRDPIDHKGSLSMLRGELTRLGMLSELRLPDFDVVEVKQALQQLLLSNDLDEVFTKSLHHISGGNPLFLTEILRGFIESSGRYPLCPADLDTLILPNTVRETIRQRLDNLSPLTRQVLETTAILETVSNLDVLRHTSGRKDLEVLESLETLVNHHLLEERDGQYRFHHELIRTTLEANMSQWRKQLLHRRAAEAFERYHPDQVVVLAWHFEQGEQPGKAAEYALQAGLNAGAVFAYPEALAYYECALAWLRQAVDHLRERQLITKNRYQQVQVLSERSWLLRLLGRFEACHQDLQEQFQLAKSLDDSRILADICASEAYLHRRLGYLDKALQSARDGLHLSQQVNDAYLEARAYREIGVTLRSQGDFKPARRALEQARKRFAELEKDVLLIHTLGNLSTLCENTADYDQALEFARQALGICEQAGLPQRRRIPLGDLGTALALLGDEHQGRDYLFQSLSLARVVGDRAQEIFCLDRLGWLAVRSNQPTEALDYLQGSLALAEQIESRLDQSHIHAGLAAAYQLSGDLQSAESHALRASELAKEIGQAHEMEIAQRILAQIRASNL